MMRLEDLCTKASSNIAQKDLDNCLVNGHKFLFRNKYILIEDEESLNESKGVFDDIMIGEGIRGIYYANRSGEFFVKSGKKVTYLNKKVDKKRNCILVSIKGKKVVAKNMIAKLFIPEYKDGDVVKIKNGDIFNCSVGNLKVIPRKEYARYTYGMVGAKPVGLYQNGVLVKTWKSARKCAEDLFCSHQTIRDACHGKNPTKLFDVRWI